jgi:putative flippase GtrA
MSFFRKKSLQRFFKYSVIWGSTFLIDLALLVIFTDFLGIYYIFSAGLAFLIAVSLNYFLSRHFVFIASKRSIKVWYLFFMIITSVGLGFVMSLMYIFVDVMQFNYILSRVGIAAVVGVWNYLMNLYFNFRVAGK